MPRNPNTEGQASRMSFDGWTQDALPFPPIVLKNGSSSTVFAPKLRRCRPPHLGGMAMTDRYPNIPGAKGPDGTSQEAAGSINSRASYLRRLALLTLAGLGEATVLEAVAAAGVNRESLQPRFSELRALGLVEPTGARRRNPSGKLAAVLRLTEAGKSAL